MSYCTERFTRLDYCQFLISAQVNYALTHFAEHAKKWSHDTINRYLRGQKITPRLVWEKVQDQLKPCDEGYLLFDDTVLDKRHARQIETVRRQWSGNAHGVIRGIGVVNCVYVNPETDQFWVIDRNSVKRFAGRSGDPSCSLLLSLASCAASAASS